MTTSLWAKMWDKRRSEGLTSSALMVINSAFISPRTQRRGSAETL